MKLSVLLYMVLFSGLTVSAQTSKTTEESVTSADQNFERFCLKHAVSVIHADGKTATTAGTVSAPDKKLPTYKDYGVTLKENETQYFTISGTSDILKVESLFRLQLMYNPHYVSF